MRTIICTLFVLIHICNLQAQQSSSARYTSWLSLGAGKVAVFSPSPGQLTQLHSAWHHLIGGQHDFIFSGNMGWNHNLFFTPDHLYFQTTTSLSYGQRTKLSRHLYFTPSIGVGVTRQTMTHFYSTTSNFENLLLSLLFNRNNADLVYSSFREKNVCVPVNFNFLLSTRFAGLEGGPEIMFAKRPTAGFRLCISLGKMYRKS